MSFVRTLRRRCRRATDLVRDMIAAAYRDFVRADLRQGAVSTVGLDRDARLVARTGFALLGLVVVLLLFADAWRARSELIVISTSGAPRGQTAPVGLLPLTLFLIAVSWAFALTAALRAQRIAALLTLGTYELNAFGWANSLLGSGGADRGATIAVSAALVGVPLLFILRRRSAARPALEFTALFALVAVLLLAVVQFESHRLLRFGMSTTLHKLDFNVTYLRGLVTPLLLYVGLDIAEFAYRAARWTTDSAAARASSRLLFGLASALFVHRAFTVVDELRLAAAAGAWLGPWLGGLCEAGLVIGVYVGLVRLGRRRTDVCAEEVADGAKVSAVPLVLWFSVPSLLIFLLLGAALALPARPPFDAWQGLLLDGVDAIQDRLPRPWHLAVGVVALVIGCRRANSGRIASGIYAGLFGVLNVWNVLTASDVLPIELRARGSWAVESGWLVLIGGCGVRRFLRRRDASLAADALLFPLLVLALMRQRDFIENPFTPVFGFAGAAFVAFGLLWDIATQGAWTNADTPSFPRLTRTYFYAGYVLLTAAVLLWAAATHDLDGVQRMTGGAALLGFDRFGKPLLYGLLLLTLLPPGGAVAPQPEAQPGDAPR